jgi:predicted alpha/beta-fold hydrolase
MRKWARLDSVSMEIVEGGGHVGFVGGAKAPGHFWAADRILSLLEPSYLEVVGQRTPWSFDRTGAIPL